jgi:hypothetical protein
VASSAGVLNMDVFVVYSDHYDAYSIELITISEKKAWEFIDATYEEHPINVFLGMFQGRLGEPFDDSRENDITDQRRIIGMIGSRSFGDKIDNINAKQLIENFINSYCSGGEIPQDRFKVLSGGAEGTDTYVQDECERLGIIFKPYLPDFEEHGIPGAYHFRNDEIIDNATEMVAFWNGNFVRSGTASVINKCIEISKPIMIQQFHYIPKAGISTFIPVQKEDFLQRRRIFYRRY